LPPHRVSQRREHVADAVASAIGRGHDRQYMSEEPDMSTISDTFGLPVATDRAMGEIVLTHHSDAGLPSSLCITTGSR
jgi:hypothetical protein